MPQESPAEASGSSETEKSQSADGDAADGKDKCAESAAAAAVQQSKTHKHDSGEAELSKVTDYVEEKELRVSTDVSSGLLKQNAAQNAKETVKITIRKEDVELIMRECEVTKVKAERKLRECRGSVKDAMKSILGF